MSQNPRRGGSARSRGAQAARLNQLPLQRVLNNYPKLEIYSAEKIEALHDTSMRILEELAGC